MVPLRVIFFGTAGLAATSLEALAASSLGSVVAVVSQPDKPRGRELQLQATPVKVTAVRLGLPVLQPLKARAPEFIRELSELNPDLIVVAAYGQILPPSILDLPRFGCLNVHTSLLPRYRGAAPIQWAIIDGAEETGVTIMKMDAGLDTGPIVSMERTLIRPDDTAETLHDRLAVMGGELLVRTIPGYVTGALVPRAQPVEGVSYARKITKEDGRLDWTRPATVLWNRIRGLMPWPGAFTLLPGGPRQPLLKVLSAEVVREAEGAPGEVLRADKSGLVIACGAEALRILRLQREGSRPMAAGEFLAGYPLAPGARF